MDEDMESVEIMFAQRLASGEPIVRRRALRELQNFVKKESAARTFTDESLARLCKGLHYTLWMQDKMLLQEELADDICNLLELFPTNEQMLDFVRVLLTSLSKEWPFIDRWRMDKFLMLLRRMFRRLFVRLRASNWEAKLVEKYIDMFRQTVISSVSKICESIKFHCAAIFLDELDSAGGIEKETLLNVLQPYAFILQENISDSFFRTICTEIFDTILNDFSEQLAQKTLAKLSDGNDEDAEKEAEEKPQKTEANFGGKKTAGKTRKRKSQAAAIVEEKEAVVEEEGLTFDYAKLAEILLDVGASTKVSSKSRKRIYGLSKKFQLAAKGVNPFPVVELPARKSKRRKRN